ncbi:MAG: DUF1080 domain-containing protein [Balneolaceae bacterium]|nr:DUF1080 domain-containing protein [Balneolaceae bacterium]
MIIPDFNPRLNFSFLITLTSTLILLAACSDREASQEIPSPESPETEQAVVIQEEGFESIFNGTDLDGWDGDERFWSVEDGNIVGETSPDNLSERNTFLIWEGGEPDNFEVRFRYRFVIVSDDDYGNSGIQIRSERFTDDENPELQHRVRGYQPDFAISDWIPGILYEEAGREILARRGERVEIDSDGTVHSERFAEEDELGRSISHTEWNDYHVYANGDTIRTTINGQLMHELIDRAPEARESGIIAFQLHSGPPMRVEITDAELKLLNY